MVANDGQPSAFLGASPDPCVEPQSKSNHHSRLNLKKVERGDGEVRKGPKEALMPEWVGARDRIRRVSMPVLNSMLLQLPISVGGTTTPKPKSLHLPRLIQAPHLHGSCRVAFSTQCPSSVPSATLLAQASTSLPDFCKVPCLGSTSTLSYSPPCTPLPKCSSKNGSGHAPPWLGIIWKLHVTRQTLPLAWPAGPPCSH